MKSQTNNLFENYNMNLKESVTLPNGYESFSRGTKGKCYNTSEDACKLNAMKAFIDDNNEDIYVGSVKVNNNEILHYFNVKDGVVIDHSGTANNEDNILTDYKGVNFSGPLKQKGYTPYKQELQFGAFQNKNGDIVKVGGDNTKPRFQFNDKNISYEELINLKESETLNEDFNLESISTEDIDNMDKEELITLFANICEDSQVTYFDLLQQLEVGGCLNIGSFREIVSDTVEYLKGNY